MDQEYLSILNLYAPNKIFSFMKSFIKADKKIKIGRIQGEINKS